MVKSPPAGLGVCRSPLGWGGNWVNLPFCKVQGVEGISCHDLLFPSLWYDFLMHNPSMYEQTNGEIYIQFIEINYKIIIQYCILKLSNNSSSLSKYFDGFPPNISFSLSLGYLDLQNGHPAISLKTKQRYVLSKYYLAAFMPD